MVGAGAGSGFRSGLVGRCKSCCFDLLDFGHRDGCYPGTTKDGRWQWFVVVRIMMKMKTGKMERDPKSDKGP